MIFAIISFTNSSENQFDRAQLIHIKTKMIMNYDQQSICHQLLVSCKAATVLRQAEQESYKVIFTLLLNTC